MTIEVPANLLPSFEKALEDYAAATGEKLTPAVRRAIEVTVLQRGICALWDRRGEIAPGAPTKKTRRRT